MAKKKDSPAERARTRPAGKTAKHKPARAKKRAAPRSAKKSAPGDRLQENLRALRVNPQDAKLIDATRAQIDAQGLDAYFQAAAQLMDPAEKSGAEPDGVRGFAPVVISRDGNTQLTWWDCIQARMAQPLRTFQPASLAELQTIVSNAARERLTVKAAGSGHSFTDVAVTADYLIRPGSLNKPLPLDTTLLRAGVDSRNLFEVESGITIYELNDYLWNENGKALSNMGGYDGQTILGVVSTSTHGSGMAFGPLADFVRSITLVAGDGKTYRIEPANGITDAAGWAARQTGIELKQDDNWFDAVRVGIGCMGVVYSVVLEVRDAYALKEERTLSTWREVRDDLRDGRVLSDNRHYEVLVNAYAASGDFTCLVTRRNVTTEPPTRPEIARNYLLELLAKFPLVGKLLVTVLNRDPDLIPKVIDKGLRALVQTYVDRSYRVFNIGNANDARAYGSEIAVPLPNTIAAVERILSIAEQRARVGKAYLTSPFSLRFVNASSAYMSMMHAMPACLIEFPMLEDGYGGRELLREIEHALYALGGRPHWGLLNFLQGRDLVASMYPKFAAWNAVRELLDPGSMFRNAFTERCGITPARFVPAGG